MTVKVTYMDGSTGKFGPVSGSDAADRIVAQLAGNPNVKSAEREA
jgi:hypothetical protein